MYQHERHPLDIIAEQESRENLKISDITDQIQSRINLDSIEHWHASVVLAEVTRHFGQVFLHATAKERTVLGWPPRHQDMVQFLKENGLK